MLFIFQGHFFEYNPIYAFYHTDCQVFLLQLFRHLSVVLHQLLWFLLIESEHYLHVYSTVVYHTALCYAVILFLYSSLIYLPHLSYTAFGLCGRSKVKCVMYASQNFLLVFDVLMNRWQQRGWKELRMYSNLINTFILQCLDQRK